MSEKLAGKVAVVTGGASGIGQRIAERFAAEGASVVVADINSVGGQAVVDEIQNRAGQAIFLEMDVTREADCLRVTTHAVSRFGRLDIMVNNAGVGAAAPIAELSEQMWDSVMAVNLKGVFLGTKHAFRAMRQTGGGVILNTASVAGLLSAPNFAPYNVSKAAVIHLTRTTALEGAAYHIRANALCPVWVDTPMAQAFLQQFPNSDAARRLMEGNIPLNRFGTPDDVAEAALFLASDAAAFITGIALPIDGGILAGAPAPLSSRKKTKE
jgi:NAD(P)-dependent dehydrogenase (short-subunit alcohol dehydrogenase family)